MALALLVDDETGIRRFLKVTLAKHGFRVAEAGTAGEAVDAVASLRPRMTRCAPAKP